MTWMARALLTVGIFVYIFYPDRAVRSLQSWRKLAIWKEQFHGAFLQCLASFGGNRGSRTFAPGQSNTIDPLIRDRYRGLFIREKSVRVSTCGGSGIEEQLLERQCTLTHIHAACLLE
jgi:hypothetical protein